MALLVAITGIVATMPYIALQLVGIEAVLKTMRHHRATLAAASIAFAVLAAYTYQSGLRAPALIAFVKDILIYIVILVAVFYIPAKLGGWGAHLRRGRGASSPRAPSPTDGILLNAGEPAGSTSRWRSARRWRCSSTRTASPACSPAGAASVIKRNMSALPAYSPAARPDRAARLHGHRGRA